MTYKAGDVVVVPFPFTDKSASKRRPALVLSVAGEFSDETGQSVCAMITSAKQSSWHSDIAIEDIDAAGLTAPSVIRMKLFTLDNRLIVRGTGHLAAKEYEAVKVQLRNILGL